MQENWNTKASLLERAQNQEDHSAWDEFVNFYKNFIRVVIVKSGINFDDIDDLVQDVLVKVWKGLPNYEYRKNQTKFRTWLSVIIRNILRDYIDKKKRKGGDKLELDEGIICELTTDRIEEKIQEEWKVHLTNLAIENVKKCFSGQAIDVFLLSLKGDDAKQISQKLNVTVDSVYVLRRRVKVALQQEIDKIREKIEFQ